MTYGEQNIWSWVGMPASLSPITAHQLGRSCMLHFTLHTHSLNDFSIFIHYFKYISDVFRTVTKHKVTSNSIGNAPVVLRFLIGLTDQSNRIGWIGGHGFDFRWWSRIKGEGEEASACLRTCTCLPLLLCCAATII